MIRRVMAVPHSAYAIGDGGFVCVKHSDGLAVVIDRQAGEVLRWCHGIRSAPEHVATALVASAAATLEQAEESVALLVNKGLLVEYLPERAAPARRNDASISIDTVVVLTSDRPMYARRCVGSIKAHARSHGRSCKVIVVDGSRHSSSGVPLPYGDDVEHVSAGRTVDGLPAMVARGVPADTVAFATGSDGIGSNRNRALLRTAGSRIVMCDDDIVFRPWQAPKRNDAVVVSGRGDQRWWRFHESRRAAVQNMSESDDDLLLLHGQWLGRTLKETVRDVPDVELRDAPREAVECLLTGEDHAVKITMTGLAGDGAMYCPARLLFGVGSGRKALEHDAVSLERALNYREIQCAAASVTLTYEPLCATYCTGVANDSMGSPFMPIGRGEDTVFGGTLSAVARGTVFCHLPVGVVHDSPRDSVYEGPGLVSARETRLCDIVYFATQLVARGYASRRLSCSLEDIAEGLASVATGPIASLRLFLQDAALSLRASQLHAMKQRQDGQRRPTAQLQARVDQFARQFVESVARPDFAVPIELRHSSAASMDLYGVRQFLKQYAELLRWWRVMWSVSRDLNSSRSTAGAS